MWDIFSCHRGATSVVKEVMQKGTKQRFAMKVIEKNVSHL